MQILIAPSRAEVDRVRRNGSWLDIGVPSFRNLFLVSKFKACCWIAFDLSSVPIHLLFNSTVSRIDFRQSKHQLTISSEKLLEGGTYSIPGANQTVSNYNSTNYWPPQSQSQYQDEVAAVVAHAVDWKRLGRADCWAEYVDCHGLKNYRDLWLIVNRTEGWIPKTQYRISNQAAPSDKSNHLFFHSKCSMWSEGPNHKFKCNNSCGSELATGNSSRLDWNITDGSVVEYCLAEPTEHLCCRFLPLLVVDCLLIASWI